MDKRHRAVQCKRTFLHAARQVTDPAPAARQSGTRGKLVAMNEQAEAYLAALPRIVAAADAQGCAFFFHN
ncbi:MAG: hypothetical protein EOO75_14730, partial [Myxococcales bacterium]